MTLQPYPHDNGLTNGWEELGAGAPTLIALAQLCAEAVHRRDTTEVALSPEANAILFAAKTRGVIEVKGIHTAFEAPDRFLAVYIELDEQRTIVFRNREAPEITIRFFEGFRQLCQAGLVMHHLYHDFSLSARGFEAARAVREEDVAEAMKHAREFGLHE